jgi:hypothetical protein
MGEKYNKENTYIVPPNNWPLMVTTADPNHTIANTPPKMAPDSEFLEMARQLKH